VLYQNALKSYPRLADVDRRPSPREEEDQAVPARRARAGPDPGGVDAGGIGMVITRTPAGDVHAARPVLPPRRPALEGLVLSDIVAENIGLLELSDRAVVRCPWHGFEYDVETGRCPADPVHGRIRVYPVSVEEGYVTVER
jgi:nitrite reductase (NADH) small subunit